MQLGRPVVGWCPKFRGSRSLSSVSPAIRRTASRPSAVSSRGSQVAASRRSYVHDHPVTISAARPFPGARRQREVLNRRRTTPMFCSASTAQLRGAHPLAQEKKASCFTIPTMWLRRRMAGDIATLAFPFLVTVRGDWRHGQDKGKIFIRSASSPGFRPGRDEAGKPSRRNAYRKDPRY